jgi:hypothetical protein
MATNLVPRDVGEPDAFVRDRRAGDRARQRLLGRSRGDGASFEDSSPPTALRQFALRRGSGDRTLSWTSSYATGRWNHRARRSRAQGRGERPERQPRDSRTGDVAREGFLTLVSDANGTATDIFVRDRLLRDRVKLSTSGTQGTGGCRSRDLGGRALVAFGGSASNLVDGDRRTKPSMFGATGVRR